MDFFSGSGTTADAVWRFNIGNNTRLNFILVQLPEDLDENLKTADANSKELLLNGISLLDEIGKPHKLTELAKYRLIKTINDIKQTNPECGKDLGFRVFRVDSSNYEDVEKTPKEWNQNQLDLFLNNVKLNRDDLDLLFGCMLDWGVKLSLPMTSEVIDDKAIYTVNDGDLVACFAEKVTDNVVKAMAEKQPLRVIFRDSCFEKDADKINIYETFKQLLDWSDKEVIDNIRVI
jgi:adenine-specific DNA-methyltransferase